MHAPLPDLLAPMTGMPFSSDQPVLVLLRSTGVDVVSSKKWLIVEKVSAGPGAR